MERTDWREQSEAAFRKVDRLKEKLARVRQEVQRVQGMEKRLEETPDGQISLADPDARSMATYGKGTGLGGYNEGTAVDTETHLIVAHEVTNAAHDQAQLTRMAKAAKAALKIRKLNVIADRGYFNSTELLACHEEGITPTVPGPETSRNRTKGMFVELDSFYDAASDTYTCPPGKTLTYRYTREEKGLLHRRCWQNDCQFCRLKAHCATGKERRMARWEHKHRIEAMYAQMDETPGLMRS